MKLVTITLQFLADSEAVARNRAASICAIDEFSNCCTSTSIEEASLDDEDAILGPAAGTKRAMDALHRIAQPLLNEIAIEVRDGPTNARANGVEDDADSEVKLREHIVDLFADRVRAALNAEFPDVTDEQHEAAMEAVVDWAFGPTALDNVALDAEDKREIREVYEKTFGTGTNGEFFVVSDVTVRFFLDEQLPLRLGAHWDDAYEWLSDCREAYCWLS